MLSKQLFSLFTKNKTNILVTISAIILAGGFIPAWFDDAPFNKYLSVVSAKNSAINQKNLSFSQKSLQIEANRNPKHSEYNTISIRIAKLHHRLTFFIDNALTASLSTEKLAIKNLEKAKIMSKNLQDSLLYNIKSDDREYFEGRFTFIPKKMNKNLTPSQFKLVLNSLKELNEQNMVVTENYFLDKQAGHDCGSLFSKYILGVIPEKIAFVVGEKLNGKIFVGAYSSVRNDISYFINKKLIISKDGIAHYAKKQETVGEKQLIVSAFIKNEETGLTTEARDTFYYEVIP